SLSLDGTDDYVDVGNGASLTMTNGLTIEAWVEGDQKTVCGKEQTIVSKWQVQGAGFSNTASWSTFDPGANSVGNDPDGMTHAVFDGRYAYFVCENNGTSHCAEVVRYDTLASFSAASSWTAYDPGNDSLGSDPDGYWGAVFDGRYIYFVPYGNATGQHGEIMRYDVVGTGGSYKLVYSCAGQDGAFSGAPFGISGIINTNQGAFSVHSSTDLAAGSWHHVAITYDGTTLSLYVDASLADSIPATGNIFTTTAPVRIGTFNQGTNLYDGSLDEVRIYNRALPASEILTHFERRKYANPEPVVNAPGSEETSP
ncbi:MAG: LamG domain-containing protein, partial [Planctomycetota bacterium]